MFKHHARIRSRALFQADRRARGALHAVSVPATNNSQNHTDRLTHLCETQQETIARHSSLARSLTLVQSQGNSDEFEGRTVARFVLSAWPLIHLTLITPHDPHFFSFCFSFSLFFFVAFCNPPSHPSSSSSRIRYFQRESESMTECLNVLPVMAD